ncbi:MAG: permease-like cell division protein FtsX [Bacteroidales bacterium]|nr:permease-like cell division protein FtsX [Bacteroidales bacterium]MBP5537106.1 permease-like cell division protein FtsX [Bacteroidales bacterium]MBP5795285.1 permease-like cell division protein FtsX [Bacteroidales bacterium]
MNGGENKLIRRRLANAYLSAVISISLVLLLVGVASLLLVNARSVSDYFKENMQISVLLKPEIEDDEASAFQSELDSLPYIHSTRFISREEGTEEMKAMLGEDFLSVFETSPIPSSLELTLKADYVSSDSLQMVKNHLLESPLVDEVDYQQSLIETLNENIGKISLLLGVFIVLLLFISFVLINNTVRLNVFARRFTIHTMKMVGATRSFIRSPFMVQAVFQGLFAAFLAILLLLVGLFFLRRSFEQLFQIFQLRMLLLTIGIVIVSGVIICVVSTYFVVNKLISLKRGELYY